MFSLADSLSPRCRVRCWRLPLGKLAALLVAIAILGAYSSGQELRAGELRTFAGKMVPDGVGAEGGEKTFQVHVLVNDVGQPVGWLLEDSDPRGHTWLDRLGELRLAAAPHAGLHGPSVVLDYGDGQSRIPVLVVGPQPAGLLAAGQTWEQDELAHEVVGAGNVSGLAGWQVSVRNNFGERRQVTVAAEGQGVLALRETFFVGQGLRHRLTLELTQREPLAGDAWQQAVSELQQLAELRRQLGWTPDSTTPVWTAEALKTTRDAFAKWEGQLATPVVRRFVQTALRESNAERNRAGALETMRRAALAQKLPEFQLMSVSGQQSLGRGQLENTVTVFHFWDYKDTPLREPYGQAGYLDYLHRKYEGQKVRVVGVVSNQQSEQESGRRSASVSARKFQAFMNLAYPLYVDGGLLLKAIGDPRTCDTPLPLFVVVGKDGQIVHYSAGFYRVEANQGLVDLEAVIKQALGTSE